MVTSITGLIGARSAALFLFLLIVEGSERNVNYLYSLSLEDKQDWLKAIGDAAARLKETSQQRGMAV